MAITNPPFTKETNLTVVETLTQTITASNQQSGAGYQPLTQNPAPAITKSVSTGNVAGSPANNVAGGADLVFSQIMSIAGAGNTVLNLFTGLYDVLGQSVSFARVKSLRVRLLSLTDDPTNGGNGAGGAGASSVTVGNATNPFVGPLGGTGPNVTLNPGDELYFRNVSAAGWTVSNGVNNNIQILNNDGANAAVVQVTIVGGSN